MRVPGGDPLQRAVEPSVGLHGCQAPRQHRCLFAGGLAAVPIGAELLVPEALTGGSAGLFAGTSKRSNKPAYRPCSTPWQRPAQALPHTSRHGRRSSRARRTTYRVQRKVFPNDDATALRPLGRGPVSGRHSGRPGDVDKLHRLYRGSESGSRRTARIHPDHVQASSRSALPPATRRPPAPSRFPGQGWPSHPRPTRAPAVKPASEAQPGTSDPTLIRARRNDRQPPCTAPPRRRATGRSAGPALARSGTDSASRSSRARRAPSATRGFTKRARAR